MKAITYRIGLGSGFRTVEATSVSDALEKATGQPFTRFKQTGVGVYQDVKSAPGHQCKYSVEKLSKY